jgi:hypothetical protein
MELFMMFMERLLSLMELFNDVHGALAELLLMELFMMFMERLLSLMELFMMFMERLLSLMELFMMFMERLLDSRGTGAVPSRSIAVGACNTLTP